MPGKEVTVFFGSKPKRQVSGRNSPPVLRKEKKPREKNFTHRRNAMSACSKCNRNNQDDEGCGQQKPPSLEEQMAELQKAVEVLRAELNQLKQQQSLNPQKPSWLQKAWEWFITH